MNKIETAKKIISKTKLALVKYVMAENISKSEKLSFMKFIKESSNYNVLHFAAKGFFPKDKTTPMKNLLEQAVNVQSKSYINEWHSSVSDMRHAWKNGEISDEKYKQFITQHKLDMKKIEGGYSKASELDNQPGIINQIHASIEHGKLNAASAMSDLKHMIDSNPEITSVGAIAAAGLALYAANKIYKKSVENAAKQIHGKSPTQAALILKNIKQKSNQIRIADLQKSMAGCKVTKNPAQCQKLIADKIKQLRSN